MPIISVFGGSSPLPDSPVYDQARQLGARLAQAGHTVATGGYLGVMEAASRGAAEAGGHVIGVTSTQVASWKDLQVNPWVKEEIAFPTLRERLYHLVAFCQAAIAMPGGIGTLSEIAFLWSMMQVGELPTKPLIAVGQGWGATLTAFTQTANDFLKPTDHTLVRMVATIDEALEVIGY